MPPVTKAGGTAFRKDVDFVAKDDDLQQATGVVMVPDKADLQNDFAREETIRGFADQFETFAEAGQAGGGIMHTVWPDGWMELERNEVLDEAEEIGEKTVDAGAWVQTWAINNDALWGLIEENVLEGYSIGAIQVGWNGPYEQGSEDVADVDTSEIPDDELVWELTEGIIREVSAVDIPAVPDAQILEAKDVDKRLAEHIGNPDAFLEEAMQRGHTEAEAERLWDVLNEAMEADGASEPGKQSVLARAGKAFLSVLSGGDSDGQTGDPSTEAQRSTGKEGRTLSAANRDSLFATIDASLDVLEDAGVDHGLERFTDRDAWAFDLTEHRAREWGGGDGDDPEDEEEEEEEADDKTATGGDTPDDTTSMSDADDPWDDAPAWAKALRDSQEENSKRIDELADGGDPDADPNKDADPDPDDPWDDAPEWAKALKSEQEENAERIDTIAQQAGYSKQLDAGGDPESEEETGLGALGKALS
jgi:hypothetical protein